MVYIGLELAIKQTLRHYYIGNTACYGPVFEARIGYELSSTTPGQAHGMLTLGIDTVKHYLGAPHIEQARNAQIVCGEVCDRPNIPVLTPQSYTSGSQCT